MLSLRSCFSSRFSIIQCEIGSSMTGEGTRRSTFIHMQMPPLLTVRLQLFLYLNQFGWSPRQERHHLT